MEKSPEIPENIFLEKIATLQQKMRENSTDIFFSRKDENVENTELLNLIGFEGSTGDILIFNDQVYFIHDSRYYTFAQKIEAELGITPFCVNDFLGHKDENGEIIPAYKYLYSQILKNFQKSDKNTDKKIDILVSGPILANDFDYFKGIFETNLENIHISTTPQNNQELARNVQNRVKKTISPVYGEKIEEEPESLKSLRPQIHKVLREKMVTEKIDVLVSPHTQDVINSNIAYLLGIQAFEGTYFVTQNSIFAIPHKMLSFSKKKSLEEVLGLKIKDSIADIFSEISQNSKTQALTILIDGKILQQDVLNLKKGLEEVQKNFETAFEVKNSQNFVSKLQEIKYPEEIEMMREAQHHVDEVLLKKFPKMLEVGITEKVLAERLEEALKAEGKFGLSFRAIVAFGENSASPHSTPSERKLKENENILIDCGVTYHGYCSDLTRNFWFGKKENIDPNYLDDFQKLKTLQENFTKTYYKEGVSLKTIALKTNLRLKDLFGDDGVRHSLGHSLGIIEVHQFPAVSTSLALDIRFKKGHIQTNEPGVYRNNRYGIRIEDSLAITENGADILTKLSRELIVVEV